MVKLCGNIAAQAAVPPDSPPVGIAPHDSFASYSHSTVSQIMCRGEVWLPCGAAPSDAMSVGTAARALLLPSASLGLPSSVTGVYISSTRIISLFIVGVPACLPQWGQTAQDEPRLQLQSLWCIHHVMPMSMMFCSASPS